MGQGDHHAGGGFRKVVAPLLVQLDHAQGNAGCRSQLLLRHSSVGANARKGSRLLKPLAQHVVGHFHELADVGFVQDVALNDRRRRQTPFGDGGEAQVPVPLVVGIAIRPTLP